jgi:hypothetical protein
MTLNRRAIIEGIWSSSRCYGYLLYACEQLRESDGHAASLLPLTLLEKACYEAIGNKICL